MHKLFYYMKITDTTLLLISCSISSIGLLGIIILYLTAQEPLSTIEELNEKEEYDGVRIQGTLTAQEYKANHTILTIEQACTTSAILYNKQEHFPLHEILLIEGTLSTYKGTPQIIVESITSQQ